MKIRMKTMATLLAAILISMMGVMPVLAPDEFLQLSVTVEPYIYLFIEIDADGLAFGTMYVGDSDTKTFRIIAYGTAAATITSTLQSNEHTMPSSFWMTYLDIEYGDTTPEYPYTIGTTTLAKGYEATETFDFFAVLDLEGATPDTYSDTLIFWIEETV